MINLGKKSINLKNSKKNDLKKKEKDEAMLACLAYFIKFRALGP